MLLVVALLIYLISEKKATSLLLDIVKLIGILIL